MSRKEVKKDGWIIAYGVDHITGAFVQVWKDGDEDREDNPTGAPQLEIDSWGIRVAPFMDKRFDVIAKEFSASFKLFYKMHPGEKPNLAFGDVLAIVSKIDPEWSKELSEDVYRTWNIDPI